MSHKPFFDEQLANLEKTLREDPSSTEIVKTTLRGLTCSMKMLLTEDEQKEVLASRHLLKSLLNENS